MHYVISNGIVVKSENAALTTKQVNRVVVGYISKLANNLTVLDYGCGKLRHSIPLYKRSQALVAIDSDVQLDRIQTIDGIKTTVREYICLYMPKAKVFSLSSYEWPEQKYDFILCSNVLSAIPDYFERQIVLSNIKKMLKSSGKALISLQYRNSYFDTYNNNPAVINYLDGWLIKKKDRSYSFYGIIKKEKLIDMCISANLSILNEYHIDGSIYLEVSTQ